MSAIGRFISDEEKIIKEAFEEKFGFPLDIKNAPLVERLEMEGSPHIYYRYQGIDFLVMDKDPEIHMSNEAMAVEVTCTKRYKKL